MTVTCPTYGHPNRETARFCGECAAPLVRERICPACSTVNPPRAYLGQGDLVKALATAREAIAVARARGARHPEAAAYIVHADVLLALGEDRRDEAGEALRQAEALIAETGAQLVTPDLHVSRAALARQRGDTAAAERELHEAQRLFTEIGALLRAAQELGA